MAVKVARECQKHKVSLDCNKCMDMGVNVAMKCQEHQLGLDSNKGMDMVGKLSLIHI